MCNSIFEYFFLLKPYTKEELTSSIFRMHPSKILGVDGFLVAFFQNFWPKIRASVTRFCLEFFNNGGELGSFNHTIIELILKVKEPKDVNNFRPISLCSVIYKIIAKAIASRLKISLYYLISVKQSAFVSSHQILNNVLVAFETAHKIKATRKKKRTYMALKLNMSKAYNRVNWKFLELIMRYLGFHECWVPFVLKCILLVSYSILLNGNVVGFFKSKCGLKQGDLLSPYLFLLCTEGLSTILRKRVADCALQRVKVSKHGPEILHLFLAYDSLLFFKTTIEDCDTILECLKVYENASTQKVNLFNSGVLFNPNSQLNVKEGIQNKLHIRIATIYDKHLGLPTTVGKSK